jgi:hypothetical protein
VGDFIDQAAPRPAPNPGASGQISPEQLDHLLNTQRNIQLQNIPVTPPPALFRPEPVAGPSWRHWDWAIGIFVLCLLVAAGSAAGRLFRPQANGPSKPESEEPRD